MELQSVIVERSSEQESRWLEHTRVGMRLDIELLDHRRSRFQSELVGYRLGRFLIVRFDEQVLPAKLSVNGLVAVCRFLVEDSVGECYAFKAQILSLVRLPDKLLFLSFPDEIQRRPLRAIKRQRIEIPASIQLHSDKALAARAYGGAVTDISQSGCRFRFDEGHQGRKVALLPVLVNLLGQEPGLRRQIPGLVRNSKLEEERLYVGIQFEQVQLDFA
ncbi:PilZ domain-containing protein [Gallaecimonas kandeliae]|uniref:PilZ domain-containing protein n=1 Tax=Gallaecimonas kandeliae TaxID=3029055 RepID=UPI002648BF7C|nr:PilZ domain-containing protein [Gallaecimonas kandeliae]WKE65311.1 PilZ domain-containing protein [Gallaecimonas kandeliae]